MVRCDQGDGTYVKDVRESHCHVIVLGTRTLEKPSVEDTIMQSLLN